MATARARMLLDTIEAHGAASTHAELTDAELATIGPEIERAARAMSDLTRGVGRALGMRRELAKRAQGGDAR